MKITDAIIEPYFIKVDENSYNLCEDKGLDKEGHAVVKTYGYFSNLSGALKKLARIKVLSKQDTISLKEYVLKLETVYKQLKEKIEL